LLSWTLQLRRATSPDCIITVDCLERERGMGRKWEREGERGRERGVRGGGIE
jgi:hypothetical protein